MNGRVNRLSRPLNISIICLLLVDGVLAIYALQHSHNLTEFLYFHLGLTGLLCCPLLALVFLRKPRMDQPLPLRPLMLALLVCLLFALVAGLSETRLVNDALGIIHRRFQQPYWQWVGLALAALIFLPLIGRPCEAVWNRGDTPTC